MPRTYPVGSLGAGEVYEKSTRLVSVDVTDDRSTRLLLIRHGESVSTVDRCIGGPRTCRGLSPLGHQQAERLRDRLATTGEVDAEVLYSSQYPRALQTAAILAPALGGLAVVEDAGFGEHDPGELCDGMSYAEFTERYGNREWDDPFAESFPGGETIAAFHFRVGLALHHAVTTHAGRSIVIACHGGVIDAVFRILLHAPPTGSFQLHTLNTALTEFEVAGPRTWKLHRYNDASHLAGLPAESPRVAHAAAAPGGDPADLPGDAATDTSDAVDAAEDSSDTSDMPDTVVAADVPDPAVR